MTYKSFIAWIDSILEEVVNGDKNTMNTPSNSPANAPIIAQDASNALKLYTLSKSLLGQHLSLNDAVPWMVGCAEAISKLLVMDGITGIPAQGIEGTAALLTFLEQSKQFQEIFSYTQGAILIATTGTGNGKIRGHVGCCGLNAIMSNNSETGKWDTQWNIARWLAYYGGYGGIKTRYFLPI